MPYVIVKFEPGDPFPDHGKFLGGDRGKAERWRFRECLSEGGHFYAKDPENFKDEYKIYDEGALESTNYCVMWEDEPEVNEFGLVLP